MNTSVHPIPWKASGSEMNTATWVEDAAGKRICTMVKGETDWNNASAIADAVNQRAELIAALQDVASQLRGIQIEDRDWSNVRKDLMKASLEKAHRALGKAATSASAS